ncbi:hypothetical protein E4K67_09925 [Desulfosporosinus fructosivorans]|uniref:Uncharacterized protein n=1 Tax=Desulfosporosinus fructosivorans TaxID=2018669 RepID=A0A4Z0R7B5_9FIRM|nr:Uma2 family endonuclease [Desulfosporosinus fructosivorans]TGE38275.1 hypothetical protein E4K67_09925 [Desulfosporosinus fructosivorans]
MGLIKFNQFEIVGLEEYWIVEPENKLVNVFVLQESKRYGRPDIYSDEDKIKVTTFPELLVDLSQFLQIFNRSLLWESQFASFYRQESLQL